MSALAIGKGLAALLRMQHGDAEPILCHCDCRKPDADALAGEILRYLQSHHHASDTTEGIARWWIKRQRLEDTLAHVQAALDQLVADARVVARRSKAGRVVYALGPSAGDVEADAAGGD